MFNNKKYMLEEIKLLKKLVSSLMEESFHLPKEKKDSPLMQAAVWQGRIYQLEVEIDRLEEKEREEEECCCEDCGEFIEDEDELVMFGGVCGNCFYEKYY